MEQQQHVPCEVAKGSIIAPAAAGDHARHLQKNDNIVLGNSTSKILHVTSLCIKMNSFSPLQFQNVKQSPVYSFVLPSTSLGTFHCPAFHLDCLEASFDQSMSGRILTGHLAQNLRAERQTTAFLHWRLLHPPMSRRRRGSFLPQDHHLESRLHEETMPQPPHPDLDISGPLLSHNLLSPDVNAWSTSSALLCATGPGWRMQMVGMVLLWVGNYLSGNGLGK